MATATGNQNRKARATLTTSTIRLSNAQPPSGTTNWLGFSSGQVAIILADPPVAISGSSVLNITALMRVVSKQSGPFTGFMRLEDQQPPGAESAKFTFNVGDAMPISSHTGDAYLAGGRYWYVGSATALDTTCKIAPAGGVIYMADRAAGRDWEDNHGGNTRTPTYFVQYTFLSGTRILVGFEDIQQAAVFVTNPASVATDAAICVQYSATGATWLNRWKVNSSGTDTINLYPAPTAMTTAALKAYGGPELRQPSPPPLPPPLSLHSGRSSPPSSYPLSTEFRHLLNELRLVTRGLSLLLRSQSHRLDQPLPLSSFEVIPPPLDSETESESERYDAFVFN